MKTLYAYKALAAIFLLFLIGPQATGQRYANELSALRNENAALMAQVDSLKKALIQRGDGGVTDFWSELTGLEAESDFFEVDKEKNSLTREEEELAAQLRKAAPFLIIPYKPIVGEYVNFFRINKRRSMPAILRRYERYKPIFEEFFLSRGIPEEVMALCIVESAVSPHALSPVGAYGMWQLMPATAREYGLEVNALVDERTDVSKSSEAAARYLCGAFREFGDWPLAVLSYNCGPGNVRKAIVRAGGKNDFWSMYSYLPRETRGYLLSLLAVNHVLTYGLESN